MPTLLTMSAVLLSFGSALALEQWAGLRSDVAVLAVVLALTLSRTTTAAGARELGRRAITLPAVALLASQVGNLMLDHAALGDALFAVVLSGAIWLRRFGPAATRIGSLISLPFIGILVVPVPVSPATAHTLWPAAIALVALGWVVVVRWIGRGLGWIESATRPVAVNRAPNRRPRLRLPPSTRMAAQLGVALELAFLAGHWLYPDHWPWVVLTCYLVCSGNRGRGDVLHKSVLRLLGASVGTVAATLLAGGFAPGDRVAVVLIFVVLAVATWLRDRSYGYWAAGVTAVLGLLNGYYGIGGADELVQRLGGVLVGAAIGVSVSWFLLPVRSGDVFRSRAASALAALSDHLSALRADPTAALATGAAFGWRVEELGQLKPTFALHRRTIARLARPARLDPGSNSVSNSVSHAVDVITALAEVRAALATAPLATRPLTPATARALGALARQVGVIRRRALPSSPASSPASNPAAEDELGLPEVGADSALASTVAAVRCLDAAFTRELWRQHGG